MGFTSPPERRKSFSSPTLHYLHTCDASLAELVKIMHISPADSEALIKEAGVFPPPVDCFFNIISKEFICNILETKKNKFFSFFWKKKKKPLKKKKKKKKKKK